MASYPESEAYRLPEAHRDELLAIEEELRQLLPGTTRKVIRRKDPVSALPVAFDGVKCPPFSPSARQQQGLQPLSQRAMRRVKYLLKRHMLIMRAHPKGSEACEDHGYQLPSCQWGVLITDVPGKPGRALAHPMIDRVQGDVPIPEPVEGHRSDKGRPNVNLLAFNTGRTIEDTEKALEAMPEGRDPEAWVREWGVSA